MICDFVITFEKILREIMFLKEIKLNYKDQGLHFNSKIQKCYITDSGHETEFAVLKYFQKNAELLK